MWNVTKAALLSILGGVIVAAAISLNFVLEDAEEPVNRSPEPAQQAAAEPAPMAPKQELELKPELETKPTATRPSFDVVRINPEGDAVMAGRAAPGAKVEIFDGQNKIGEVVADQRGEWVFVPSAALPAGSRQLSLKMTGSDGAVIPSETDVVLVVPEKGKDIAGRPAETPDQNQPLAMKVPSQGDGPVEVLQKPGDAALTDDAIRLAVDAVDYDENGKVNISGKAPPQTGVHLYLNNEFVGRGIANERGLWSYTPADAVEPGVYTLRADMVDPNGKVTARLEVVFSRSVPLTDVKPGTMVVVEPGNSLWRIARKTYGSGFQYTVIYNANKEQIKNADMIFPGQVFTLPSIN
jgi:LysM repeat protein